MAAIRRTLLLTTSTLLLVACSDGRSAGSAPADPVTQPKDGPIRFVDATAAAGIEDVGLSFGVAAGDFDGDGLVDLFTTGHFGSGTRLWRNLGDGTFADVAARVLQPLPSGDMHGAQWADIDEDGLPELLILCGAGLGASSTSNRLYSWQGSAMTDVAKPWGIELPEMRGRNPLAIDYDRDGRLDLFMTALWRGDGRFGTSLLLQRPGGWFADASSTVDLDLNTGNRFAVLGDLDGDARLDALFDGYPLRAFALGGTPIDEITDDIGLSEPWLMTDAVLADLTGDGRNEIYIAHSEIASGFHLEGDRIVEFRALVSNAEHGLRIQPNGSATMTFGWGPGYVFTTDEVFIGADGHHPPHNDFTLSAANPANHGVIQHLPGQDAGLYIGWDPALLEWRVSFSSPGWNEMLIRAVASDPISPPVAFGFDPTDAPEPDSLLMWQDGRYVEIRDHAGLPKGQQTRSVVAADFDNDMDLDLYLLSTGSTQNTPNLLLENAGDGTFSVVADHGAAGTPLGIGDAVVSLDYDRDGRVDLFSVNGSSSAYRQIGQSNAFADDGPVQLFRNTTVNSNHWLGIELFGIHSTRSGIGARIEVTAGGRTQVREHSGGMHRQAQNHGIHFGMGPHAMADEIVVSWPSGHRTVLQDIRVDRTLVISERTERTVQLARPHGLRYARLR